MKKETIMELLGMALENNSQNKGLSDIGSEIKIVILQRGWVVIGKYEEDGEYGVLTGAYVIRNWGTDKGIGQLALNGKQNDTTLDKVGLIRFHKLTTIALIDCNKDLWKKEF